MSKFDAMSRPVLVFTNARRERAHRALKRLSQMTAADLHSVALGNKLQTPRALVDPATLYEREKCVDAYLAGLRDTVIG